MTMKCRGQISRRSCRGRTGDDLLLFGESIPSGFMISLRLFARALIFAATAGGLHANLLEYGSFDDYQNGKFEGWSSGPKTDFDGKCAFGSITQDAAVHFGDDGSSAAFAFTGKGSFRFGIGKKVDLTPGQKYRLSIHVKAKGGPFKVILFGSAADAARKTVPLRFATLQATEEWQNLTIEFSAEESALSLSFGVKIEDSEGAAGTVWVDEAELKEAQG